MFKTEISYDVLGVRSRNGGYLLANFASEYLEDCAEFLTILSIYDDPFWIIINDDYNQRISLEIHANIDNDDGEKIKNIFKDTLMIKVKNL